MLALVVAAVVASAALAQHRPVAATLDPGALPAMTRGAERIIEAVEVVSVYEASGASADLQRRAHAAARAAGAASVTGRSASIGMVRITRGGAVVQAAPTGWLIPMGVTVLPADAVGRVMSREVGGALARGELVIGRTSADLRGARAGDQVTLLSAAGQPVTLRIGLVADDAVVGGAELVIGDPQADRLGLQRESRVLIWGFASRQAIDEALAAQGLVGRVETRIRRGWDPRDPDGTLGMAATKAALGEFAYRVEPDGSVSLPASWIRANISGEGTRTFFEDIAIRAACHVVVRPAIQAALTEIVERGLVAAIDVANTNAYGGCFNPRFNRVTGTVGFLSRHTWGMAFDANTDTNAQGQVPQMDCRVVRIFRQHGFAWGGNFTRPDGMHFEWVGAPRHELPYPSRYCPNLAPLRGGPTDLERDTLFAHDGFAHDGLSP